MNAKLSRRNGSFEPKIVVKGQTRFSGFGDRIISMYRPQTPRNTHPGYGDRRKRGREERCSRMLRCSSASSIWRGHH
jgi:hypothetical protein